MNHPITPLASSQINHDHLTVELVEPDSVPPRCASSGHHSQPWLIRSVSPMWQPRSRNSLREPTSCWPQSERSSDSNRAGRQGMPGLTPRPLVGPPTRR